MGRPDPGPLPRLQDALAAEWKSRSLAEKGAGEATAFHHSDLVQGGHADCNVMAGMAALVQQHPDPDRWMRQVIKANADGSYTVTFYERQVLPPDYDPLTGPPPPPAYVPRQVTIRDPLAGAAESDDGKEKWPAVIEKAYAEAYGGKGDRPFDERGNLGDPMERLTGIPSTRIDPRHVTIDQLDGYLKDHQAVVVKTFNTPPVSPDQLLRVHPAYAPDGLARHNPGFTARDPEDRRPEHNAEVSPWHEYYVHRVDKESGTVVLHNVWNKGREDIKIPIGEFQTAFERVTVNPVYKR